jgi:RNA polymerase sigma factor (sigma-70 family)
MVLMNENSKKYSNSEILEGIRSNKREVLNFIYSEYYSTVSKFVLKNSGNEELAWDLFQDAVMITYDKVVSGKLMLTSTFKTFFVSICKNLWYKYLRDRLQKEMNLIQIETLEAVSLDNEELQEAYEENILFRLLRKHLGKISKDCQEVLKLSLEGYSGTEIVEKTKFSSPQAVYNKKGKCIKKLMDKIKTDQEYKTNFGKNDE